MLVHKNQGGRRFWLADSMDDLAGWRILSSERYNAGLLQVHASRGVEERELRYILVRDRVPGSCPDCNEAKHHRTVCPHYDAAVREGAQPCLHCGPRVRKDTLPPVCPHCGRDKDAGEMI